MHTCQLPTAFCLWGEGLPWGSACLWATVTGRPEPCSRYRLTRLRCPQELSLSESLHFMVPGLASVAALSDLRSLSMERVGVTNGVLRALGGLIRLRSLHIPDAFRATDAGIAHLSTLTGELPLLKA